MTLNERLFDFIKASPTPFHAAANICAVLEQHGFKRIAEGECGRAEAGRGYFVTRNNSTVLAFRMPPDGRADSFVIAASHGDSPSFRVKSGCAKTGKNYACLGVEAYGGALYSTWFDRPLSVAGRLLVKTESGLKTLLCNVDRDLVMIPSLPIHYNRDANKGVALNVSTDMSPTLSLRTDADLLALCAESAGCRPEDVVSHELRLYCRDGAVVWGSENEFISSPRLDDLQCAFATLEGFLSGEPRDGSVQIYVCFDCEEIGSGTMQGAEGTLLSEMTARIGEACGNDRFRQAAALRSSFLLSADNAHAVSPTHPELFDPENMVVMNGGVVLKHGVKYATDAVGAAIVGTLAEKSGVKLQTFHNRSDLPGGSTLGSIVLDKLSIMSADVGLAQLAMHSSYETAGAEDTEQLVLLSRGLFSSALRCAEDGKIDIL